VIEAFRQLGYPGGRIRDELGSEVEFPGFNKRFKSEIAACSCELWVIAIE
jgi:hypothetical protein